MPVVIPACSTVKRLAVFPLTSYRCRQAAARFPEATSSQGAEQAQLPQPLLTGRAAPSHLDGPLLNSLIFPGKPKLDTVL